MRRNLLCSVLAQPQFWPSLVACSSEGVLQNAVPQLFFSSEVHEFRAVFAFVFLPEIVKSNTNVS